MKSNSIFPPVKFFVFYLLMAALIGISGVAYWHYLRPLQEKNLAIIIKESEKNYDSAPVFWYASKKLKTDSTNTDLYYAYYIFGSSALEEGTKGQRRNIEKDLENRYQRSLGLFRKNPANDHAALQCLMHNLFIRADGKSIHFILKKNDLSDIKYGNYLKALISYGYIFDEYQDTTSLQILLTKEEMLPQGGYKKGVAEMRFEYDTASIQEKMKNPLYLEYIDESTLISELWYDAKTFVEFYLAYYPYFFQQHPASLLIALAGALLWILFFYRIDVFEREKIPAILIAFLLGMLSILLVDLKNFYWDSFSIWDTGYKGSEHFTDRLFSQLYHVGIFEEGAKMCMFIVLLFVRKKWINESFDYVLYPALIAIGFSFVENVGYIYRYQADSLGYGITRTMLCTLGHISFSIVWGWGFYLASMRASFLEKGYLLVSFYLIASLMHALYNASLSSSIALRSVFLSSLESFITVLIVEYIVLQSIIQSQFFREDRLNYNRALTWIRTGFLLLMAICYIHYLYYFFYNIPTLQSLLRKTGLVLLLVFFIDFSILRILSRERVMKKKGLLHTN